MTSIRPGRASGSVRNASTRDEPVSRNRPGVGSRSTVILIGRRSSGRVGSVDDHQPRVAVDEPCDPPLRPAASQDRPEAAKRFQHAARRQTGKGAFTGLTCSIDQHHSGVGQCFGNYSPACRRRPDSLNSTFWHRVPHLWPFSRMFVVIWPPFRGHLAGMFVVIWPREASACSLGGHQPGPICPE